MKLPLYLTILSISLLIAACRPPLSISPSPIALPISTMDQLRSVAFIDENVGLAVGGQRFDEDVILRTEDGGQNWERVRPEAELGKMVFSLTIQDSSRIFGTSLDGKVLRSLDGGKSWNLFQQAVWMPMHNTEVITSEQIVAVGGVGYSLGQIVRSEDGGDTWQLVDTLDFELRDVDFLDTQTGFACGYGAILKSKDGGKSWSFTSARKGFFSAMDWPNPQTGYVVGRAGTILKTIDGGENWAKLRNGNSPARSFEAYNDVVCWNESLVYIIGDRGEMRFTEDGGDSWQHIDLQTQANLHGLYLTGPRKGWICGSEGFLTPFEL